MVLRIGFIDAPVIQYWLSRNLMKTFAEPSELSSSRTQLEANSTTGRNHGPRTRGDVSRVKQTNPQLEARRIV